MKNNKKLYLLAVFALAACVQEVSAMNSVQKAVQCLGDYKFALGCIGVTVYCAFEFHKARSNQEELIKAGKISPVIGRARELIMQDSDRYKLQDQFASAGFRVQFANMGFRDPRANMAAGSAGNQAFLLMSPRAMVAFLGGDKELSREEMELLLKHELVHALDRHVEKGLAVGSFLPVLNFFLSAGIYKGVSGCLDKFDELSKPIAQVIAATIALGAASAIKMNEEYIKLAHRRSCEWKADGAILDSEDRIEIETYRDYYKKMKRYDEDQKLDNSSYFTDCDLPWYRRTNPTHDERIEACDKALAELEAAKK